MIRLVFFLIVVGAISLGVAWFADRPGDVVITWQGLRIETSLMVLAAAILALMALLGVLWSLVRTALRSPVMLANHLRNRRGARAFEAISSGLVAVGAGDIAAARQLAAEVNRLAPSEPLALLLSAQSAQLSGDRDGAERAFHAMASRADTKALGLHGLYIEAQRRDDPASAQAYAEEAARTAPSLGWAGRAVLEFRCAAGDWAGALALLERRKSGLDNATYQRQRAVLLTARALEIEDSDRDGAKAFALEAVKLAPTLVPAAALAARMLAEGGELRKASRMIARAWNVHPHPDLAQTYAELRFGDAARDRLARVETLAKRAPGNIEGALATARAALDAREFAKARAVLTPYLSAPIKRVALMMATLERAEHADEGRAREWMARALNAAPDPQWTADGYVSDRWLPVSPISGRLDAFEWRVPLTGAVNAPLIEPEPPPVAPLEASPEQARETEQTLPAAQTAASSLGPPPRHDRPPAKAPAVIPLVHAPDDPGTEAVDDGEPSAAKQNGGWRKVFD
jgi:HemY protein